LSVSDAVTPRAYPTPPVPPTYRTVLSEVPTGCQVPQCQDQTSVQIGRTTIESVPVRNNRMSRPFPSTVQSSSGAVDRYVPGAISPPTLKRPSPNGIAGSGSVVVSGRGVTVEMGVGVAVDRLLRRVTESPSPSSSAPTTPITAIRTRTPAAHTHPGIRTPDFVPPSADSVARPDPGNGLARRSRPPAPSPLEASGRFDSLARELRRCPALDPAPGLRRSGRAKNHTDPVAPGPTALRMPD
jgi:hypothetical protein